MSSRPASRTPSRSVSSELSPEEQEKAALVTAACHDHNLDALVHLATTRLGLVTDPLRRTAWPLLLGCTDRERDRERERHVDKDADDDAKPLPQPDHHEQASWKGLLRHSDEEQVALDVNRAFVYYPKNESEKQLDRRKEELSDVIIQVLRRHPSLCYFQGYHDIAQVLLLVLGPDDAPAAVARLSLLRIRDFMLSKLDPAMSQLELLRPLMAAADPVLYRHLPKHRPTFALAGTITLFAHIIKEYRDIARLFDFFLAQHTVIPIYFFAAIVLSRRDEILDIDEEDEDIMSAILGKLPEPFDLEFHIARAVELYERLPPESLASWEWWRISSSSVLKTSSTPLQLSQTSLEEGEKLLQQQEKDIQRQKALENAAVRAKMLRRNLWLYRRYSATGVAVVIGVYALWLGRTHARSAGLIALGPVGDLLRKVTGVVL
ncbi:hypothetical protein DM02DRAFT_615162 [Periconia macrospinosa]|uniref:Rab-GAP TBC domain-containing protein n=1 Tax=Periconia macrospinosa TaxID=97972 RepID=A0A2V1DM95_9PLEO|nr:hypothetical protein DM02DRAFT_615162 [Periconia macrospinosa]